MTTYGIIEDAEYTATHKRQRLTLWSPPFASVYEGEAFSRPKGFTITTYNGDTVRVDCPSPYADDNWQEVRAAINDALNEHHAARGDVQMVSA